MPETMEDLINIVRDTLLDCPEVIAQSTEANASITIEGGEWVLVDGNYVPGTSTVITAWLQPKKMPANTAVPGVQPADQYYEGRLIEPRTLTTMPRSQQVNECVIEGEEGQWVWLRADDGAFKFEDIIGTPICGFFRRT